MSNYPMLPEEHDDEAFEAYQLSYATYEPSDYSDPAYEELLRLQAQLATYGTTVNYKYRRIAEMYCQGKSKQEIIDQLQTTYQTIGKALQQPKVRRLISLIQQVGALREGPSLEARRNLAWRIATKNADKSPHISLRALDLLNKQAGDYQPDQAEHVDTGLVVKTMNFTVNVTNLPNANNIEHSDFPDAPIIEGEFTPVTVEVPDDHQETE